MSNAQSYIDRIEDIDAQIKALNKQRGELLAEFTEKECPVKVGATVTVNGYSHRGKKMLVRAVKVETGWRSYRFVAIGDIYKKDGSVGVQIGEWSMEVNRNGKEA